MKTWVFPFRRRNGFEWTMPVAVALERRAHAARLLVALAARASRTSGRRAARASPPRARGSARRTCLRCGPRPPSLQRSRRLGASLGRPSDQNERDWPPSIVTHVPTTHDARCETRNVDDVGDLVDRAETPPRELALRRRPRSPRGPRAGRRSQLPPGNSVEPGATLNTRIPSFARSRAIAFARLISAALATL